MGSDRAFVVGVDLGGSTTRVLVVSSVGTSLRAGTAGGGNPVSRGCDASAHNLAQALHEALGGIDKASVRYGVLGVAGGGAAGPEVDRRFAEVWRAAGLDCPYQLVSDLEVAFASVAGGDRGLVLVAGTGAAAGRIAHGRLSFHTDGCGWLVGDGGSGFWLGRAAVKAALAAIEGRGPSTALAQLVVEAFGESPGEASGLDEVSRVVFQVYRGHPLALAQLAPLVLRAATGGDQVARLIVRRAADQLMSTILAARGAGLDPVPVVLGGSLLTRPNPLAAIVRQGVRKRLGVEPLLALDGAKGAALLALEALPGRPCERAGLLLGGRCPTSTRRDRR